MTKVSVLNGFEYCEFWTWKNRNWEGIQKAIADSGIIIAAFSGDDAYSLINTDESSPYVEFLKDSIEKAFEAIKGISV
jgi:hypothetical protein